MTERFYIPELVTLSETGGEHAELTITGPEAHHIRNVLRLQTGDAIELFDGHGRFCSAILRTLSRKSVVVSVGTIDLSPPPNRKITLAVAFPKGDRAKMLVEKVTELGVTSLVALKTERSVAHPDRKKCEKLFQTSIAACKQSGRNRLLDFQPVQSLDDLLANLPDETRLILGDPAGESSEGIVASVGQHSLLVVVGPEGGFSPAERSRILDAGAIPIRIGTHILRIETAAIALAAFFAD